MTDSLKIASHVTSAINKAKATIIAHPDFIESIQPYFKYVLFLMWIIGFIWVNRIFIKDPILRAWIIKSFEENGKASGKSLTAFMFAQIVALASMVSIIYAPNHLMPEYFLYSLLMFVASVYGIKLAGKFADNKSQTSSSITSTTSTTEEKTSTPKKEDIAENKEEPKA